MSAKTNIRLMEMWLVRLTLLILQELIVDLWSSAIGITSYFVLRRLFSAWESSVSQEKTNPTRSVPRANRIEQTRCMVKDGLQHLTLQVQFYPFVLFFPPRHIQLMVLGHRVWSSSLGYRSWSLARRMVSSQKGCVNTKGMGGLAQKSGCSIFMHQVFSEKVSFLPCPPYAKWCILG